MENYELIELAGSVVKTKKSEGLLIGDVGCALLTEKGNIHLGVCTAVNSRVICAEQNAIGAMITSGEYKIERIVAVWKDENDGLYVISPCGSCRQYIKEIDKANLDAEIILDKDKTVKLIELLPFHDWWKKQL